MSTHFLFVIHSPGGANFAFPIIRELAAKNLTGVKYDVALLSPWVRDIINTGFDVSPEPEAVVHVIKEIRPDVVLYETGPAHPAALAAVAATHQVNAVSICMLDWCGNYNLCLYGLCPGYRKN